jgi:molecular chaperone Hsp33
MTTSYPDRWIKCISTKGNIRGVAIQASGLIREMAKMHKLEGEQAKGLGEAVIGALLIASYCKQGERVNLNIRASGHTQQALVDAYPDGKVRGYTITNNERWTSDNKGPWGEGLISVLRTKDLLGENPYIGTVPLITGHLAKDLTFYWVQSEQIPSSVGLSVKLKGDQVVSAGGFLVQAMPGATDQEIKDIETHIQEIQKLDVNFESKGTELMGLLAQIFQDTPFVKMEEKELKLSCQCSWERVYRAISLVGAEEIASMVKEESAFVRCDFCTKEYEVKSQDLKELLAKI